MVNFSGTFHARNAIAFEQEAENHFGLFYWQVHAVQMIFTWFRENLAALGTLKTLAIGSLSELTAVDPTGVARHFDSCFLQAKRPK